MNNQNKNFGMFYSQSLEPELIPLEAKRKWVRIPSLLLRISVAAFFYLVLSGLGTVFLKLGEKNKDDDFVISVIQGFFCLIFCGIFLIVSNYLVKYFRKLYPESIESKTVRIIAVLLLSLVLSIPAFGLIFLIKQHINVFTFGFIFKTALCVIFISFPFMGLLFWWEKRFCNKFKQHIISQLVPFVFPGGTYSVNDFISKELCITSKLFGANNLLSSYRYKFNGSDLVNTKVGNTELEFSQLRITEESGSGTRSSTSSQAKEIFCGLFCIIKGSTYYPGEIIIRSNTGSERFAGKLNKLFHVGSKQVKTGDEEFDTNFLSYADNEQSALVFLSPDRRKIILNLINEWETTFSISFIENTVFIAISITDDIFNPTIFHSFLNIESTEKYYHHLQKIGGLTKLV